MRTTIALLALVALSGCAAWRAQQAAEAARQSAIRQQLTEREQARARLEWIVLTNAQDQCNAGQQSSCIILENWYAERRQEKAQEQANVAAFALEQQAETAAAQRQRDADRSAWWRSQALQSSIDKAAISAQPIYTPPTFHGPNQDFLQNLRSP